MNLLNLKKIHKFIKNFKKLKNIKSYPNWMIKVIINRCLDNYHFIKKNFFWWFDFSEKFSNNFHLNHNKLVKIFNKNFKLKTFWFFVVSIPFSFDIEKAFRDHIADFNGRLVSKYIPPFVLNLIFLVRKLEVKNNLLWKITHP